MNRMTQRALWGAALVGVLVLGACGSDDDASSDSTAPAPTTTIASTTVAPTTSPGTAAPTTSGGPAIEPLYSDSEAKVGISDDSIKICVHGGFSTGKAVFSDKDASVYWQALNDAGGINGRKVDLILADDEYTPQGGIAAAEKCKSEKAFLILGTYGVDTMPAVAGWAEENEMIYLPGNPVESTLADAKFTFYFVPTTKEVGRSAGRFIGANHPENVGMVWRNSPNWQEFRDGANEELTKAGVKTVTDVSVKAGETDFSSVIQELRNKNVETAFLWLNNNEFSAFIKQASAQGYHARWVGLATNLATALGDDINGANGPSTVGVGTWGMPYNPGVHTGPTGAVTAEMEAAFAKYNPEKKTLEFDFNSWLMSAAVAKMLEDCGKDCDRNSFAAMLLGGYTQQQEGLCALDFGSDNPQKGAYEVTVSEAIKLADGKTGWEIAEACSGA